MKQWKSSEALRQVRADMERKTGSSFICFALKDLGAENTLVYRRVQETFATTSIICWLEVNHPEFAHSLYDKDPDNYKRIYRLAWIDWMIPQYEAIGD